MSAYPAQAPAADPTAVLGRRILAFIIDLVILGAVWNALFWAMADSGNRDLGATCSGTCLTAGDTVYGVGGGKAALLWGVYWVLAFLLAVVLQGMKGFTPGKAITGIRTVNEEGQAPGILKALIRWVLLIVDFSLCFLIGLILAITTKGHRRLGDMAAKTFVVRKADAGRPVVVPGMETAGSPYVAPVGAAAPAGAYGAAPPVGAPPVAEPAPAAAPSAAGADAQWDPARNAYIQWDPTQQQWLQFDDATQQWRRIDQ